MLRQWRVIYDEPMDGRQNMAVDDAILDAVSAGHVPPTLRLYAWNPACLSLGYGQKESDVDYERAALYGWDVVRRPTGGKAILHTDELTYSVTLPADHPIAAGDIVSSYRTISQALMAALESLGAAPHADRKDRTQRGAPGAVCFEVPSHYEITVDGRKLVGSAQVRRKNGVLQHGTLPLTGDITRICEVLAYPDEESRQAARIKVLERAITLEEALGQTITWTQAADAVLNGFRMVFDLEFEVGMLTAEERAQADRLSIEKYATAARQTE